jgi:hypothetical protein
MANLNGFNAHEVEPTTSFEPLPAGKYIAAITASEIKPTKKGDGSYLQLEFTVLEGDCRGRKVWDRLCINHPTELTQKIARGNLSAICRAVGVMQPRDSVELHNIPIQINVKCKKRDDAAGAGEITNEIKGYEAKAKAKTAPAPGMSTTATSAPASAAGGGGSNTTPPWKR